VNGIMRQWWRVGGVCGILFLVLAIVGGAIQGTTPTYPDDSVEEIRAYWVDDGENFLIGDYIVGLGFILFYFPFISALRSLLGIAEGAPQMWSRIVFAGGLLFIALAAAAGFFWTTLAYGSVAEDASDETIQLLMALDIGAYHFLGAGFAIMTFPAALVILRTGVLPMWHGVLTLIAAVLATLSLLAILAENPDDSPLSWIGFLAAAIWVLITSIVLIMKKEAPVAAPVTTM
jgi:hypothetical protein